MCDHILGSPVDTVGQGSDGDLSKCHVQEAWVQSEGQLLSVLLVSHVCKLVDTQSESVDTVVGLGVMGFDVRIVGLKNLPALSLLDLTTKTVTTELIL